MKKVVFSILLLAAVLSVQAQGIIFKNGDFDEVKQLAKQENKMIFIDFYTSWCGPCKMIAKDVFPQAKVGDYFNNRFVSYKTDAEKEGKELAKKYNISAYPSMVFLKADGEMLHKIVGACDANKLIAAADYATNAINNPNSLVNLKKLYPQKKTDEKFLLKYIDVLVASRESPVKEIKEYLKIQTSMKENEVEMMEFLLKYSKYLFCGGKAEQILNDNFNEFMSIATKKEEGELTKLRTYMIRRTGQLALIEKNVELYEVFMKSWLNRGEKARFEDYNDFRLELLLLKGEKDSYKKLAEHYLDSLITTKPIEQIHYDDSVYYKKTCDKLKGRIDMYANIYRSSAKDLDAGLQVKAIEKIGSQYLKNIKKRKEFKNMARWIEYGKQLLPDDYRMANLEANMLYRQGRKKDAIEAKKKVLDMIKPNARERNHIEAQLKKMKNNKF